MMGLGDKNNLDPILKRSDYEHFTPLYIEMKIAAQYLHTTHSEFLKLPIDERRKLVLFEEMNRGYEKHQIDQLKDKQQIKQPESYKNRSRR